MTGTSGGCKRARRRRSPRARPAAPLRPSRPGSSRGPAAAARPAAHPLGPRSAALASPRRRLPPAHAGPAWPLPSGPHPAPAAPRGCPTRIRCPLALCQAGRRGWRPLSASALLQRPACAWVWCFWPAAHPPATGARPHTSGSVRHGRRLQAACSRCMTGSSAAHHQAAPADGRRLGGRRRRMIVLPLVRGDQQARVRRRALHVLAHGAVLVCAFVVAARVRVALHDLLTILSPPAPRRSLPPLQLPAPRAPCACEAFRGRGDHAGGARR